MMDRRSFFRRSAILLPALVVGEEALEAFARLTHVRKSFPSAGAPTFGYYRVNVTDIGGSSTLTATLQGSVDGRACWRDLEAQPLPYYGGAVTFAHPLGGLFMAVKT